MRPVVVLPRAPLMPLLNPIFRPDSTGPPRGPGEYSAALRVSPHTVPARSQATGMRRPCSKPPVRLRCFEGRGDLESGIVTQAD